MRCDYESKMKAKGKASTKVELSPSKTRRASKAEIIMPGHLESENAFGLESAAEKKVVKLSTRGLRGNEE